MDNNLSMSRMKKKQLHLNRTTKKSLTKKKKYKFNGVIIPRSDTETFLAFWHLKLKIVITKTFLKYKINY